MRNDPAIRVGRMAKRFAYLTSLLLALFVPRQTAQALPASLPTQAPACTTAGPVGGDPGATVCVSDVVVNVDGTSPQNWFYVSWISSGVEAGSVQLVDGASFGDARGSAFTGITHYVQVNNLQSNTAYQFDIISGATTFDNNKQHWSVTLGPALPPAPPNKVFGLVKNQDGSDASDALIYVSIQHSADSTTSALLSGSLSGDNVFQIALGDARTSDFARRFSFDRNKDKLLITANGPGGFASTTVTVNVALPPQPNPPNVILTLGSGVVAPAPTSTPTPPPPTSTPTPVTPSATPTLIPPSATAFIATETAAAFTETATPSPTLLPTITRPRPSAAATLPAAPTLTSPPITIAPAQETQIAEATLASTGEPNPEITRVAPRITDTAPASSLLGGLAQADYLLPLLAVAAFGGAVVLGLAAIFIWKR